MTSKRPKKPAARSVMVVVRVTPREARAWRKAADADSLHALSQWVRQTCQGRVAEIPEALAILERGA